MRGNAPRMTVRGGEGRYADGIATFFLLGSRLVNFAGAPQSCHGASLMRAKTEIWHRAMLALPGRIGRKQAARDRAFTGPDRLAVRLPFVAESI